ncbi:hypothetical protein F8M41_003748 [Gigaspora margarita]|uniref:Uncharacterized protein n=1 Tax=Gigaspora margarita TaxID=4874 RepID=A0A8H4A6A7_GIGMA|nr:hypothetical protein F8M41_003748 [Gigaspora margarita]
MANTQSKIDLLEKQNSKLLAEITMLRKENVEIPELRRKFAEVEAENEKLTGYEREIKQDQIVTNSQEAKFQISDPSLAC